MNRDDLSPAERRVRDAFAGGEVADFRTGVERGSDGELPQQAQVGAGAHGMR